MSAKLFHAYLISKISMSQFNHVSASPAYWPLCTEIASESVCHLSALLSLIVGKYRRSANRSPFFRPPFWNESRGNG